MKRISAILLILVLCISVLSISAFAAYDSVQSLAIVGSGIPGVNEWDPADPAGDMTKVSDGIYEKVLSLSAGTTITFKIAGNDTWDDSCNFGTGSALELGAVTDLPINAGGGDMTFTASSAMNLKITVNITSDVATILLENTEEEPIIPPIEEPVDPPAEGMITVHAYVADGITPKFWAWRDSPKQDAFEAWPGEPMTKDGQWWTIQVPNWCTGMIVNDGGTSQTADLTVEAGKEVWIVVNPYAWSTADVYYEEPNLKEILPKEPPAEEELQVSRPTLGATTPRPDKNKPNQIDYGARKAKALTIIGTIVLAIVAVSFVLSIPKKIR